MSSSAAAAASASAAAVVATASPAARWTTPSRALRPTLAGLKIDVAEAVLKLLPIRQQLQSGTRGGGGSGRASGEKRVSFSLKPAPAASVKRRRSTVARREQHLSRTLLRISNGLELTLESCVLPPACHGLLQTRIGVSLRSPTSAFGSLVYDVPAALQESVREHSKALQARLFGGGGGGGGGVGGGAMCAAGGGAHSPLDRRFDRRTPLPLQTGGGGGAAAAAAAAARRVVVSLVVVVALLLLVVVVVVVCGSRARGGSARGCAVGRSRSSRRRAPTAWRPASTRRCARCAATPSW